MYTRGRVRILILWELVPSMSPVAQISFTIMILFNLFSSTGMPPNSAEVKVSYLLSPTIPSIICKLGSSCSPIQYGVNRLAS